MSGDVAEVADGLRALLADLEAGELSCSAAMRHRIEGAVLALEVIAAGPSNDRMTDTVQRSGDAEHDQG
jgi:hypothetical protein